MNPKILIESFKKELENKTKLTKIKYNIGKNEWEILANNSLIILFIN